eukprot:6470205-Amphidinium_carterae.1
MGAFLSCLATFVYSEGFSTKCPWQAGSILTEAETWAVSQLRRRQPICLCSASLVLVLTCSHLLYHLFINHQMSVSLEDKKCLGGGPPSAFDDMTMQVARSRLVLPGALQIVDTPMDGLCFFHSLVAAARDSTTKRRWTALGLKQEYAPETPDEGARAVDITAICQALHLCVVLHRVDLPTERHKVDLTSTTCFGDLACPAVHMIWWHDSAGSPFHFEYLSLEDEYEHMTYKDLLVKCKQKGVKIMHRGKGLHLKGLLRSFDQYKLPLHALSSTYEKATT